MKITSLIIVFLTFTLEVFGQGYKPNIYDTNNQTVADAHVIAITTGTTTPGTYQTNNPNALPLNISSANTTLGISNIFANNLYSTPPITTNTPGPFFTTDRNTNAIPDYNAGGLTNLIGTNIFQSESGFPAQGVSVQLWPGASPGRIITIITNAGFTISSFVPNTGNNFSSVELIISNSTASTPFTVTITAPYSPYNASTASSFNVGGSTLGYIYADTTAAGASTNMADYP